MRIGFIGAGNMATALIRGMLHGGERPENLQAFDISEARRDAMRALGVRVADSLSALVEASDTVVLAIKPNVAPTVLRELGALVGVPDVLSIVVSLSQQALEAALSSARGVALAMPNTSSLVGEGVIAFNENHTVAPERFEGIRSAFSRCGRALVVPERLMGAVTAISGSGPAYVYLFIEALADAGVREGLPRATAYELAAQTLLGASRMVLETGEHPGKLKDDVCSPGGTTIEAVCALERAGLRAAVQAAVDACARKAEAMGK